MARPLFVKVASAQKPADEFYIKKDGNWKQGRLIYKKVNGEWCHEHDYRDNTYISEATCQNGATYRSDCPCGNHGNTFTSGDVNPNNHTGSEVYGGTADSHTEYNCCGKITSSTHTFGSPSYTWNQTDDVDTTSCVGSATCSCTYKKEKDGTVSINNYYAGTCQDQEKWDYKAVFDDSTFTTQVSSGWRYGDYDYSNHTGNWRVEYISHGYESGNHTRREYYDCCDSETGSAPESCREFSYTVVQQPTCGEPGVTRIDCGLCRETCEFDYYSPAPTGNHVANGVWASDSRSRFHWQNCRNCNQDVQLNYEMHTLVSDGFGGYYCDVCGFSLNSDGSTM